MKKTARVILTDDGKYVFMKRIKLKDGKKYEYYATIGGHLEKAESFEEAAIREAFEELGVQVNIDNLFFEYENKEIDTYEKYYFASIVSGVVGSGKGEEFLSQDFEKYGSYEVVYVNAKDIESINLLPGILKEKLLSNIKS